MVSITSSFMPIPRVMQIIGALFHNINIPSCRVIDSQLTNIEITRNIHFINLAAIIVA